MVRGVFKLKDVQRAKGSAGVLQGYTEVRNETERRVFLRKDGSVSVVPEGTMQVVVSVGFFVGFFCRG
jgi:hypothetical protein